MPSVSKKQQKFMGIVRAIQKGEADPSDFNKDAQDAAKKMKKSSVKKYAKTKHKGLPTKKVSEDRDYKDEYKKFQSSTKAKKYRAELNKYNRQKGTYGNGDGKDASHKGGKIVGFESQSKNRGRAEKSRLKKEINDFVGSIVDEVVINELSSNGEYVEDNARMMAKDYKRNDRKLSKAYDHIANRVNQSFPGTTKITKRDLEDIVFNEPFNRKVLRPIKRYMLDDLFENMKINENPAAIAAAQRMVVQSKGKKVSVNTARNSRYKDKDPAAHKKAKSIFQRIVDKFKKKNEGTCGYGMDGKLGEEPAGPHLLKKKKKKNMKEASIRDVKRAIQIAKSMGGNMTGAIKKIEKMKRGLAKHKDVKNALRKANEGLADRFKKNIDRYNKKAKKSRDAMRKLKKKKNESTLSPQNLLQIAKQMKEIDESVNEIKVWDLEEACWKGYEKKGMKKMFGKMYPNCVKKKKK